MNIFNGFILVVWVTMILLKLLHIINISWFVVLTVFIWGPMVAVALIVTSVISIVILGFVILFLIFGIHFLVTELKAYIKEL